MSRVIDGSTCQVVGLRYGQVPLVAGVQNTVCIRRSRTNREYVIGQTSTIAVDVVQARTLHTIIQHTCLFKKQLCFQDSKNVRNTFFSSVRFQFSFWKKNSDSVRNEFGLVSVWKKQFCSDVIDLCYLRNSWIVNWQQTLHWRHSQQPQVTNIVAF